MRLYPLAFPLASAALASAGPCAAAHAPKHIIVMVADGAGFNTLEAVRLWSGRPLAVDGPGWKALAQSTYPLRTGETPQEGAAGLRQDSATVYDPEKAWDATPVPGPSRVKGYEEFPASFAGYEWSRETHPDSANTASAMMTGVKSYNNAINVNGNGTAVLSLAELSHRAGRAVGVVTTVEFSDATPAAAGGAHSSSRQDHAGIARQLFGWPTLSVIGGTGNPDFDNDGQPVTKPQDDWMPLDLWSQLKAGQAGGWTLVQDRAAIQAIGTGRAEPPRRLAMIAKAFKATNQYRADRPGTDVASYAPGQTPRLQTTPTLSELAAAALRVLGQDRQGLFLLIEGGAVDRAMHADNFGRMIEEYQDFDQAVRDVMAWVASPESRASWKDTLLIVTADHDHNLYGPDAATIAFQPLQDRGAGKLPGYRWFGKSHSNNLVPLFAFGAGSEGVAALARSVDLCRAGEAAGCGRGRFTDQAALGRHLQALVGSAAKARR
jgi:alkaline phosphatase